MNIRKFINKYPCLVLWMFALLIGLMTVIIPRLIGCAEISAEMENICQDKSGIHLSLPNNVSIPDDASFIDGYSINGKHSVTQTITEDFSSSLKKLSNKLPGVTYSITDIEMTVYSPTDLSSVSKMSIVINSEGKNDSLIKFPTGKKEGNSFVFNTSKINNTTIDKIKAGPVDIKISSEITVKNNKIPSYYLHIETCLNAQANAKESI